jgi:hypothetical protein
MKYLICSLFAIIITSCEGKKANYEEGNRAKPISEESDEIIKDYSYKSFGDSISRKGAVPANTVAALMGKQDSLKVKIRGEITEVCQKKGCWMMMDIGNDEKMRISFKDYGFFVPKDIDGQYAIVEGVAKKTVLDIPTLRHYAQDAGKDPSEVESISEPEENFVFVAEGVIVE